ncbi:MAG: MBL fold metallo-hydrolase [Promethearchaeota archaeon]
MFFGRNPRKKTVRKINPQLYYFAEYSMLDCNIYVLTDNSSGKFWIIDTGNGQSFPGFKAALNDLDLNLSDLAGIMITHEHLDHILGLYAFFEDVNLPSLKLYVSPFTKQILEKGDEEQICPSSLGISAVHFGVKIAPLSQFQENNKIQEIQEVHEGDIISLGKTTLQVLETPGHSIGSISFFDSDRKILFPGDVVFPQGSFGRYDFPGGNLATLISSVKRLADLPVDILCAGHMPPVLTQASSQIQLSYQNISSLMRY